MTEAATQICAECMNAGPELRPARGGMRICQACAEAYYTDCAGCRDLLPIDESVMRDGSRYCAACFRAAGVAPGVTAPQEAEVPALVAEYLALQAEEKRVKARMGQIKEQLKAAAALRQRVAGRVELQSEAGVVRCSYSVNYKCDSQKVAALEPLLGPERFEALFERRVEFRLKRQSLEDLPTEGLEPETLAALREAIKEEEVVRLTTK